MTHSSLLPDRFNPVLNQAESADEFVIADVERKQIDVVREGCGGNQHIGDRGAMAEAVAMKQFRKAERDDGINGNNRNSGQLLHGVFQRDFVALACLNLCNRNRRDCDVVEPNTIKHFLHLIILEKKFNNHVSIANERAYRHAIFRISLREIFLPFHKPKSSRNSFSDLNVPLGISFRNVSGFLAMDFFFFVLVALAAFITKFFRRYGHFMFSNKGISCPQYSDNLVI